VRTHKAHQLAAGGGDPDVERGRRDHGGVVQKLHPPILRCQPGDDCARSVPGAAVDHGDLDQLRGVVLGEEAPHARLDPPLLVQRGDDE
jgi:hypothetical protein